MVRLAPTAFALLLATRVFGQDVRFFYPLPREADVVITKGLSYGPAEMELHVPRRSGGAPLAVLLFFSVTPPGVARHPIYDAWARAAAGSGLAAVLPNLRDPSVVTDFGSLLTYLSANATRLGLDATRIVVFAGSGNVSRALPLVQDPAERRVAAAVLYYGVTDVPEFRRDLPLLFVRAGLDRPPVNRAIADLMARAVAQNAPVTLVNHPSGHHGFEIVDDDDATRAVIGRTLAFAKEATEPAYQEAVRRGVTEATAAAHVMTGNFQNAAARYAQLVAARPEDPRLRLSYGEALLGSGQFAAACAEFEKLKGKSLGARDLGLPAARACLQKGDADAAIAWLASIPRRFLPDDVQQDPVFAPLRSRPEFQALFTRR
ncbi:MAG TPA: tetratricopeptide repeat protein [Vicinamibacterales bacterium]|nr:tetratricopeptide repeat protein [Vicinamibacterales bacterium]